MNKREEVGTRSRKIGKRSAFADLRGTMQVEAADDTSSADETPAQARRPSATEALARTAFEAAVDARLRRRLMHGQALAVTVVVASAEWVSPIATYVRNSFGTRWRLHALTAPLRRLFLSDTVKEISEDLSEGRCVMCIAADESFIPENLARAADIAIRLPAPTTETVRRAIRLFTKRPSRDIAEEAVAGLGFHDLVAALRPGTGPRTVARRLETAAAASHASADARVPDLATAVEYGAARVWGLNLARDIAEFRAGRIAWRDVDRGICLHSPPGMGKTLFAQVLAQHCGVPLVTTSVGAWFADSSGDLGAVVKQARAAFAQARTLAAPVAILFIDEIDALPSRATMTDRAREWWTTVVTDVLTMLDSAISGRDGIVVVGATNAIDQVDSALLRPGRLERRVEITPPDADGALSILRFHLAGDIQDDLSALGPVLAGSTGAEIMALVRAARRAARHAGRPLSVADLERVLIPREEHPAAKLFRMAVHEAAHAVVAMALDLGVVEQVVLRGEGDSGGRMTVRYHDDDLVVRSTIEDRITAALAGRAAEQAFAGAMSVGSGGAPDSDIGYATALAASLHASFALRGAPLFIGSTSEDLRHALAFDPDLRTRVEADLRRLQARAARRVAAHGAAILAVAKALAEKRRLSGAEVEEIVRAHPGQARRRQRP
ncbi:AAA family ATPase [Bradyrhizobium sp. USDA 4353]